MRDRNGEVGFEEFFALHKDQVLRVVLVAVGDRPLADDAVSEAFTRALRDWDQLQGHPSPVAWVVKTAFNYAHTVRRRDLRLISMGIPEATKEDDPPTDPELVRRVLVLPERQRQVIALRILLDMSTEQTADVLGIAPGTVTAHLFRALSRIKAELSETPPSETSAKESWR